MITYEQINLHKYAGKLLNMLVAHACEVFGEDHNFDIIYMSKLIELNLVRAYGAIEDEKIVGYAMFVLSKNMFRAHVTQAECTALYIQPAYRDYKKCVNLFKFSEKSLITHDSINEITIMNNLNSRLDKFYKRMNFKAYNTQLVKEV